MTAPAPTRVARGVPTGGQFATSTRAEAGLTLGVDAPPTRSNPEFVSPRTCRKCKGTGAHAYPRNTPAVPGACHLCGGLGIVETDQSTLASRVARKLAEVALTDDAHHHSPAALAGLRALIEHEPDRYETALASHKRGHPGLLAALEAYQPPSSGTLALVPEEQIDAALDLAVAYCDAAGGARPGMCQTASWTIREEFGWDIVSGIRGGIPHTWNRMPDGRIFDATAAQFGEDGPLVTVADDPRYVTG